MGPVAAGTKSDKKYKKSEHQKKRIKETVVLKTFDPNTDTDIETQLPGEKEFGSTWAAPSDGKTIYYTEQDIRRLIDSTIQIELNKVNGREHYAYCLPSTYYSYSMLEELYEYTNTNNIDDLLKIPVNVINDFIKIKAEEVLRK
jgi:hypothetical protein